MATIVGGLRARLIYESVYADINAALTEMGWLDTGRSHADLVFKADPTIDGSELIEFNTLVLTSEDTADEPLEVGSRFSEHRTEYYLSLYAESRAFGQHLSLDIKDYIQGRMPVVGLGDVMEVFDYSQATPPLIAIVNIENVMSDRSHRFDNPWQEHLHEVSFTVVDAYGTDQD
jgi:hypothetical protein